MYRKLFIKILIVSIALVCTSTVALYAASTTFNVRLTTFGVSSVPPTVPTNLIAIPMSPQQINLSWSPSIPTYYALGGYRVYRNSLFIATTTTELYIDTNVSPATTYIYRVDAFDTALNISDLSAPVSTTTLPIPVLIPGANNYVTSQSSIPYLNIYNIVIEPSTNAAKVSFMTNMPTREKLFWGITSEYEKYSLSGLFYGINHELQIVGLLPNTKYFLRIHVTDSFGRTAYIDYTFMTHGEVSSEALPNPSGFTAIGYSDRINLSWTNPTSTIFDKVRIVRSENFYPRDQFDGDPIYEGRSDNFVDQNVVPGKKYYYAIFSMGNDGSYSSGALASAKTILISEGTPVVTSPFEGIEPSTQIDPRINALTLLDFQFIQDGKILVQDNNSVTIDASKNLTVRLGYDRIPEILKNIVFAIGDPRDTNKVFSFLLRVNLDKSAFEATVGPFNDTAKYSLDIMILDFQNKGLKKISGEIFAKMFGTVSTLHDDIDWMALILIIILLLIILFMLILWRRRDKNKTNESIF